MKRETCESVLFEGSCGLKLAALCLVRYSNINNYSSSLSPPRSVPRPQSAVRRLEARIVQAAGRIGLPLRRIKQLHRN